MIRINLRPVRISKRQEAVQRELVVSALGLGMMLLVLVFFYIQKGGEIEDIEVLNSQMQQEVNKSQPEIKQVDEINKMKSELVEKLTLINQLEMRKTGPVRLMDEISTATPEKLTLTSLAEQKKMGSNRGNQEESQVRDILLEGYALDHGIISQFHANLKNSNWFDEVYLLEIEEEEMDGFRLHAFSMSTQLKVPLENDDPKWCGDGDDNDGDGYFDCEDSDCADDAACGGDNKKKKKKKGGG